MRSYCNWGKPPNATHTHPQQTQLIERRGACLRKGLVRKSGRHDSSQLNQVRALWHIRQELRLELPEQLRLASFDALQHKIAFGFRLGKIPSPQIPECAPIYTPTPKSPAPSSIPTTSHWIIWRRATSRATSRAVVAIAFAKSAFAELGACSDRGLRRRSRLREYAIRLCRDRLRKLPIEPLVILECENHEPKRVIFPQTQLRLNSSQLVALALGCGAPQHALEARQRRSGLIHYRRLARTPC